MTSKATVYVWSNAQGWSASRYGPRGALLGRTEAQKTRRVALLDVQFTGDKVVDGAPPKAALTITKKTVGEHPQ
jgi:hypothetical protein